MPEKLKIGGSSTHVPEPIGSTFVSNIREMLKGPPVLVRGGGMGHNRELWKKRQAELQKAEKNPPPSAPMIEIIHDQNGRIITTQVKAPNTKAEPQAVPKTKPRKALRVAIPGVLVAGVLAGGGFIDHAWGTIHAGRLPAGTTALTEDQSPFRRIFNQGRPLIGFETNPNPGDNQTVTIYECDEDGRPIGESFTWNAKGPTYGATPLEGEPGAEWTLVCMDVNTKHSDGTSEGEVRTGTVYTGTRVYFPGGWSMDIAPLARAVDAAGQAIKARLTNPGD